MKVLKLHLCLINHYWLNLTFAYNNINYTIEANNFKNQILMQSAVNFPINPNDKITEQFKKFSQFWSCLKKLILIYIMQI